MSGRFAAIISVALPRRVCAAGPPRPTRRRPACDRGYPSEVSDVRTFSASAERRDVPRRRRSPPSRALPRTRRRMRGEPLPFVVGDHLRGRDDHRNRRRRRVALQTCQHFGPEHVRHPQVEKDHIRPIGLGARETLDAAARLDHAAADRRQAAPQQVPRRLLVVDHERQRCPAGSRRWRRRRPQKWACSNPGAVIGTRSQNVEPSPSALSTPTVPPRSSASRLDSDSPRPVPRTFAWSRFGTWPNSWKSRVLVLLRDADAGIASRSRSRCRRPRPPRHPHLALLGELQRVRDVVAQDLRDLALVGVAAAACRRRSRTCSVTASLICTGRIRPRRAPNSSCDRKRRRPQRRPCRLRPSRDRADRAPAPTGPPSPRG